MCVAISQRHMSSCTTREVFRKNTGVRHVYNGTFDTQFQGLSGSNTTTNCARMEAIVRVSPSSFGHVTKPITLELVVHVIGNVAAETAFMKASSTVTVRIKTPTFVFKRSEDA